MVARRCSERADKPRIGGRGSFIFVASAALALSASGAADNQTPPATSPHPWAADAELFDIFFIDPLRGWAVGQHGVIWHSSDGGVHWTLQHFLQGCCLQSVAFADEQVGWAVGYLARPFPIPSAGIVLRTSDGGAHWQAEPKLLLPALHRIQCFDRKRCIAVGQHSLLYPAGVALTLDGGQNWSAPALAEPIVAHAADYHGPREAILATAGGNLHVLADGSLRQAAAPPLGLRRLRDLKIGQNRQGWAVGDGGLVLHSVDAGRSWNDQTAAMPPAGPHADWHSIAAHGSHVWFAGSPGDKILHSADDGHAWQTLDTGQRLPLNRIFFADDRHGWAVGALGTILRSDDAGLSWQTVHAGGRRAAWLAIYTEPQVLPAALLAKVAAGEGNLGAAHFVVRRDLIASPTSEIDQPWRALQMIALLGGCRSAFSWRFPVRERNLRLPIATVCEDWSRLGIQNPSDLLAGELAEVIATWRPEVIFTHSVKTGDPLERFVQEAVLAAVEQAASPPSADIAGRTRPPWQVKAVYGTRPQSNPDPRCVIGTEVLPSLGTTVRQFSAVAASLMPAASSGDADAAIACDLLRGTNPSGAETRNLISAARASLADCKRAAVGAADAHAYEQLRAAIQHTRNLNGFLRLANDPAYGEQLYARLQTLVSELDLDGAAWFLHELANRYFSSGKWDLATNVQELLIQRGAQHPYALAAAQRLIELRTSGEAYHRFRGTPSFFASRLAAIETPPVQAQAFGGIVKAGAIQPPAQAAPRAAATPTKAIRSRDELLKLAMRSAATLERLDGMLYAAPSIRFPLAQAQRALGDNDHALRYLSMVAHTPQLGPWKDNAAAELRLAAASAPESKPMLRCARAEQRPYLDGKFDDDVWLRAMSIELASPYRDTDDWPTIVRLAYDQEFLYWSADCRTPSPSRAAASEPRQHDADIAQRDRLELFIDLDRDYVSYYHLAVDDRGRTRDQCLGDLTWNPQWFVAHRADNAGWRVEAAIPLAELCDPAPASGVVWALGIQRIVPDRGFQSAAMPSAPDVQPEGFALLRFE